MGTVTKEEVKFENIPQHVQQAALDVIVYLLTNAGIDTPEAAQRAVEETKKAFLKLYE